MSGDLVEVRYVIRAAVKRLDCETLAFATESSLGFTENPTLGFTAQRRLFVFFSNKLF